MLPYKTLSVYKNIACYIISMNCQSQPLIKALHQPHRERPKIDGFNSTQAKIFQLDILLKYFVL